MRLLTDGELAMEADAQRQLYYGLRLAGRQQLRQELRLIHARLHTGRFAWLRRLWPG